MAVNINKKRTWVRVNKKITKSEAERLCKDLKYSRYVLMLTSPSCLVSLGNIFSSLKLNKIIQIYTYILVMQCFRVVYRAISHESLVRFLRIHTSLEASVYAKKLHVTSGMFYGIHEKALHITILYHVIENTWHYIIDAVHDGKVGCDTDVYTTAFLYSDWRYFLWHGINIYIYK